MDEFDKHGELGDEAPFRSSDDFDQVFSDLAWKRFSDWASLFTVGSSRESNIRNGFAVISMELDLWEGQALPTGVSLKTIETFTILEAARRFSDSPLSCGIIFSDGRNLPFARIPAHRCFFLNERVHSLAKNAASIGDQLEVFETPFQDSLSEADRLYRERLSKARLKGSYQKGVKFFEKSDL